jgi:hypothetical protein
MLMMLSGAPDPFTGVPDHSRDSEMLAFAILANAVWYAVIGLIFWFLFLRRRKDDQTF